MSGAGTPPPLPIIEPNTAQDQWLQVDPEIRAITGLAGVKVVWSYAQMCWRASIRHDDRFTDVIYVEADATVETWRLVCGGMLDQVKLAEQTAEYNRWT